MANTRPGGAGNDTGKRPEPTSEGANPALTCAAGLLLPGLGHVLLGRVGTGVAFLASIGLLFGFGIAMHGEFFGLDTSAPLTFLAALAEMGAGGLYLGARALGLGGGDPAAPTYEYGYAFLIVAGLLNLLVVLDAWDIATGARNPDRASAA